MFDSYRDLFLTTSLFICEILVKEFGLVFWHQKLDLPWSVDQQAHSDSEFICM